MSKEIPAWEPDFYLRGTARAPNLWLWWWSRWRHLIRCKFKHSYSSQKVIPPWHGIKWKWIKSWPDLRKNPVLCNWLSWSAIFDMYRGGCCKQRFGEAFSWLRSRRVVTLETREVGENRNDCFWGFLLPSWNMDTPKLQIETKKFSI